MRRCQGFYSAAGGNGGVAGASALRVGEKWGGMRQKGCGYNLKPSKGVDASIGRRNDAKLNDFHLFRFSTPKMSTHF